MRKIMILMMAVGLPMLLAAQVDSVKDGVCTWPLREDNTSPGAKSTVLFEGKTRDFAWLQMNAMTLDRPASEMVNVPQNEEHLYIVKKGTLSIDLHDSLQSVVPGSVALLLPGEHFSIKNNDGPCEYYV